MTKEEIALRYGVSSFRKWSDVPKHYHTRTSALREKIIIPADAKPDAIKNSSSALSKDKIYLLFNINKYNQSKSNDKRRNTI